MQRWRIGTIRRATTVSIQDFWSDAETYGCGLRKVGQNKTYESLAMAIAAQLNDTKEQRIIDLALAPGLLCR